MGLMWPIFLAPSPRTLSGERLSGRCAASEEVTILDLTPAGSTKAREDLLQARTIFAAFATLAGVGRTTASFEAITTSQTEIRAARIASLLSGLCTGRRRTTNGGVAVFLADLTSGVATWKRAGVCTSASTSVFVQTTISFGDTTVTSNTSVDFVG